MKIVKTEAVANAPYVPWQNDKKSSIKYGSKLYFLPIRFSKRKWIREPGSVVTENAYAKLPQFSIL